MRYCFFTCGGSQFWEDVFFYQKWRIQRNHKTKEFRLLDPWDIRRYEGGFEECRQAFVRYISLYQLSRQKGHMIVMIHGFGDSKNVFKPMWREALKNNYLAAAVNYPSTQKNLDGFVKQFNFFLNHLEDVQEISFISLGIGGIILRKLLASKEPWVQNLKINRAVQVCPPNQGSALLTKLASYPFLRKILGPACTDFSQEKAASWDKLRLKTDVGVIFTQREGIGILRFFPKSWAKYFSIPQVAEFKGEKDCCFIPNFSFNPFRNRKIVSACLDFLKNGNFKNIKNL